MKFKVGDKVKIHSNVGFHIYKDQIGIIIEINKTYFCVVKFNDTHIPIYEDCLEPYYSTHDILEEIICS